MERSPLKVGKELDVTPPSEGALDFDDDTLIAIAEVYFQEGNKEHGKKEFSNAVYFYTEGIKVNCKDDVKNAKLYSNRATAYFRLGNYRETLNDAKAAIALKPTFIKAIERGASACVKLQHYEEAIAWCDKGLALDENNSTLFDLRAKCDDELLLVYIQKNGNPFVRERLEKAYCRLKIARQMGDKAGEGRAYCILGSTHSDLGNFKAAIRYHERDLNIAKQIVNKGAEGRAFNNLGIAYKNLGDLKRAKDCYERSLKINIEVGDRNREGGTYANLGNVYQNLGELVKAMNYYELHLNIAIELGDRSGEGRAYGNFGNAHFRLGNFTQAVDYHERALRIAKEVGDKSFEGATLANLGNDNLELGFVKKAIHYHHLHLEIAKELGNRAQEGQAYGNLGVCYHTLGEIKTSIDYHELGLKIAKELEGKAGEANAYGSLGNAYRGLGNFRKAIDYSERQMEIAIEIGDKAGEGKGYGNLGIAHYKLGNFEKAIDHLQCGLKICKELGDRSGEGDKYGNLGNAYHALGDFKKSIEHHDLHLRIAQELKQRAQEGRAYGNLAGCYQSLGDLNKGIEYNLLSLKIAKEVGDKYNEAETNYNLGLCFESQGSLSEALNYYQTSVAMLNKARDRLQFQDDWKISLRDMYQTVYRSLWRVLLKQGKVVEALSAADQGRAQALKDLLESKYGFERPRAGSRPLEESMYDTLCYLPSNTVFIAVQKREIFYWVIEKGKDVELRSQEISENVTGDATTNLQSLIKIARENIGVRSGVKCEDRSLDQLRDDVLPRERSGQTETHSLSDQTNALRTLYDIVIGPIADLIHGDELIIVPEGPLCLAPYAAFVDSDSKYLAESYRIRVLPSLNSLKLIADCPDHYHSKGGALLVGDPWVQAVVTLDGKKLEELPCAKEEVEMIGRILNYEPLTGTNATKDVVLKGLSSVELVHIAAHGDMQTGEIALAPISTLTSQIPNDQDYLLTMEDVLSVKLQARLVVLSCCHSARGEINAEGVVGIARAFLGAGARSVLVSLWAIDDEATLEFMKSFYHHLVKGTSASEALNQAMKCLRESDKFNKVKYWAPFVLIGDDVTLEFGGTK